MSNSTLEDGRGTGNKAEVDDHGRLSVKAVVVSHMSHHATYHKNAYTTVYNTTLSNSTSEPIAFLYNDSQTKDIEVYSVMLSSNADIEISIAVNDKFTSGGVAVEAVNTNLSTTILPTILTYSGGPSSDLILNTTNSIEIGGAFSGAYSPLVFNLDGSLVLAPKTGVTFYATGIATNKVKASIAFALHNEGSKL